jgi:GTP-binding protein EngB required for normal cell division
VPASVANALRRDAVAALEAARAAAWQPLPRAEAVEPPVPYPEDTLSYLANVYNVHAAAFYARHGVKAVDEEIMDMLDAAAVSYRIVITKSDKIKATDLADVTARTAAAVRKRAAAHPDIIATSSEKGMGMAELRAAVYEATLR